jgi:hypothetical protein
MENIESLLTLCAFAGIIIRTIIVTVRGVKNKNNGTPASFDPLFWLKDNALNKITSAVAIIMVFSVKIPIVDGPWKVALLCVASATVGYFIDKAGDTLSTLAKTVRKPTTSV